MRDATEGARASGEPDEPEPETREDAEESGGSPARNAAEWITLLVSFLVVALLVGAALYEQLAREEPSGSWIAVELNLDQAVRRDDLFYIPFVARNAGTAAAEDVVVVFAIMDGDEMREESTTTIPFLPNSGSVDGQLVTAYDPTRFVIEARPATLLTP
ncbi:MAG: hypothetical protein ACRDJH_05690 [Thermomicrobiales bacterium]